MSRVMHFEIHCADLDRAEAFYTSVFDWTVQRWEGPMDYRLITTGPDGEPGINGAFTGRQGEIDGEAVIAFVCTIGVGDLAATQEKVVAGGGTIAVERMEIPGVGDLAYFKDTEGNIFGAIQPV
jgi:predicted enzyme related to lactoylglutathione lyase